MPLDWISHENTERYMLDTILTMAMYKWWNRLTAWPAATADMTNYRCPWKGCAIAAAWNTFMLAPAGPRDTNTGNATATTTLQESTCADVSRRSGGDLINQE
ncbi:hypothetical protein NDU88_007047 [Pleurodeles waltl]|uniref:Uncharacterized protein n=1 Tax=Pleurodeles waltl TaxID=8319 RepID=A0AAV7NRY3_PLEWA|nr:hypothetical protein NDU88_007047 [Pleurodeles waltl]